MIEYEKRAMIEAEDKYTFRQSTQISMQTGLIGHLRADMDTDGNGFFSSWFDFREELKTDEFKAEFDDVINSLREEGDILHNRRALAKYCYCTPQSRMQEEPGYYGVRVDTEKYAYLLRLNPDRGEYNLYCYCYRRDWLDQHLKDAEKGIRFIDSHYKELFRIPDGGKVKIHYSWNEDQIRTCRYIDDYHVEIGSNLYHICEFAERMEYGGHTCEPVRDNLPERCYSVLSGSVIISRVCGGHLKAEHRAGLHGFFLRLADTELCVVLVHDAPGFVLVGDGNVRLEVALFAALDDNDFVAAGWRQGENPLFVE